MKASELITHLGRAIARYGDRNIKVNYDGYILPVQGIKLEYGDEEEVAEDGKLFSIDYGPTPYDVISDPEPPTPK